MIPFERKHLATPCASQGGGDDHPLDIGGHLGNGLEVLEEKQQLFWRKGFGATALRFLLGKKIVEAKDDTSPAI